jgi:autotransporter translocation and assembly factor TamB
VEPRCPANPPGRQQHQRQGQPATETRRADRHQAAAPGPALAAVARAGHGAVDVAGTLKAPQGKLGLQGSQLAFADNRLQSLNLDATLDSAQRAKIDLKGSGIQAGDTNLGTLTASAQGDIKQQKLTSTCSGRS